VHESSTVQLAPPGAGLPFAELIASRLLFRAVRNVTSRDAATKRFETEAQRILHLVNDLPEERANKPMLIPRVWGIEDSSRNWSALMTLDHLVIVNPVIAVIIEHLVAGKTFNQKVLTQNVKPPVKQTPATISKFANATNEYIERVNRLPHLKTITTHVHPWFGPLNAHGWHCLAAIHQTIHLRQLEAIVNCLRNR
jgi:hypothetical protein